MTGNEHELKDVTYPSPPPSRSSLDSNESLRALEVTDGPGSGRRPTRSYSVSGFQFEDDLLPLTLSETAQPGREQVPKNIGIIKGISLIVGLQIGSGIFSSPGIVVANTNSIGASLTVWALGSVLAWTGASSFAELGSAIPLNGGAQAYLNHAFGPLLAYLFAWTAISALKPGSNAIIALVFGEYVTRLFYHATGMVEAAEALPAWSIKLSSSAAILLVTILGIATPNLSTRAAVGFATLKILSLVSITVLGLVWLARGKAAASWSQPAFAESSTNPSSYALALYSALWAVDGWDNYIGGEMRNPSRSIPIAIHSSMAIVMSLFLAVNTAYFVILDKATVAKSNTVGLDAGRALFGSTGGVIFTVMIAISCFGAMNGSFITSAHLIYVAGKEGYLPSLFGRIHQTRGTPLNAFVLQAILTMMFILLGGGFRTMVNFATVSAWGFYFLTVLGLIILRFKEPYLERPYKTFLITPITFCSVALFLLCMPVVAAPLEALAALAFILAGIPIYFLTQRQSHFPSTSIMGKVSGICGTLLERIGIKDRGGWVPVSTEADGEEGVEMSDTRWRS